MNKVASNLFVPLELPIRRPLPRPSPRGERVAGESDVAVGTGLGWAVVGTGLGWGPVMKFGFSCGRRTWPYQGVQSLEALRSPGGVPSLLIPEIRHRMKSSA